MAGEPWRTLLKESGASWCNWSWFAGRPVPGQWAFDMAQIAVTPGQAVVLYQDDVVVGGGWID